MPISVTCPSCQAVFRVPDELAGKRAKCQKCSAPFDVPEGADENAAHLFELTPNHPGNKTKTSRDTAIASPGKVSSTKTHLKKKAGADDPLLLESGERPTPRKQAKSGGGVMTVLLLLFIGGGFVGCLGCGAGVGWFILSPGGQKADPGPIAINFPPPKALENIDGDMVRSKLDGAINDKDRPLLDGFKDKDRPARDGKKDGGFQDGPPLDSKKDGPPPIDANKDKPPPPIEPKKAPLPIDPGPGNEKKPKEGEPKTDPKVDPKDDPKVDPKPKDPPKARPLEKDDITTRVLTLKGGDGPLRNPIWAADGKSFFVLWQNGILQRINADTGAVAAEQSLTTLAGPDASLGMSSEGLVVALPRDRQVSVIDPNDFKIVKKRILLTGIGRLASAPDSKYAVVAVSGVKAYLRVLDLERGESGPTIPFKIQILNMRMSPDGKFVLFSDNGKIMRYRFDGVKLTFEENTPYQVVSTPGSLHISADSQFVSLTGSIAAPPPNYPGRELFVFSITNLKKPAYALPKLDFPRTVVVDTVANWVYTNDTKKPLIIYNMAGVKQGEFPMPDMAGQTIHEFLVSPLGHEFLMRTTTSIIHVKIKIPGATAAD